MCLSNGLLSLKLFKVLLKKFNKVWRDFILLIGLIIIMFGWGNYVFGVLVGNCFGGIKYWYLFVRIIISL